VLVFGVKFFLAQEAQEKGSTFLTGLGNQREQLPAASAGPVAAVWPHEQEMGPIDWYTSVVDESRQSRRKAADCSPLGRRWSRARLRAAHEHRPPSGKPARQQAGCLGRGPQAETSRQQTAGRRRRAGAPELWPEGSPVGPNWRRAITLRGSAQSRALAEAWAAALARLWSRAGCSPTRVRPAGPQPLPLAAGWRACAPLLFVGRGPQRCAGGGAAAQAETGLGRALHSSGAHKAPPKCGEINLQSQTTGGGAASLCSSLL